MQKNINSSSMIAQSVQTIHQQNFKIHRVISSSEQCVIYGVTHNITQEEFCVKVIKKEDVNEIDNSNSISSKVSLLKLLNHPNIIHYYDIIEDEQYYYVYQEFCHGMTLLEYINERIFVGGTFDEKEIISIMLQILSGLIYMHHSNIAHRDLKPENIMVIRPQNVYPYHGNGSISQSAYSKNDNGVDAETSEDYEEDYESQQNDSMNDFKNASTNSLNDSQFDIGNFQFSGFHGKNYEIDMNHPQNSFPAHGKSISQNSFHQMSSSAGITNHFSTDNCREKAASNDVQIKIIDFGLSSLNGNNNFLTTFCGSLEYASPEIIQNVPYNGCITDIWSLGVIFYIMLTKSLPFNSGNITDLTNHIIAGDYERPTDASPEALDLLSRMLDPNPESRISAGGAINHPFFVKNGHKIGDISKSLPAFPTLLLSPFPKACTTSNSRMATIKELVRQPFVPRNSPMKHQTSLAARKRFSHSTPKQQRLLDLKRNCLSSVMKMSVK
ncbi:hypothetical protein TRFO_01656 [Tritrichomonas foetus]|uniref:Protein kinase domain-containing protein n=1 Tax=Tritrichomonas foetus TaxID=1144522 RepID=A0A1J4JU90_9EUKA|nr:hypothetical protein TRFO_01656 [Tritrichomonas foetus]|eukprot:OHT01084.1 hypothetical protein TRFO_01656 [Tritrichomonas foetus]